MKHFVFFVALTALLSGAVYAAETESAIVEPGLGEFSTGTIEVGGILSKSLGNYMIQSGKNTYEIDGIRHLTGFIAGLTPGAQVKVEGHAKIKYGSPNYIYVKLTKVIFNGKEYAMDDPLEIHTKKDEKH